MSRSCSPVLRAAGAALLVLTVSVDFASPSFAAADALLRPFRQKLFSRTSAAAAAAGFAADTSAGAGPCAGGYVPFEPSWRGVYSAHAVDVTGVTEHHHDKPLAITAAAAVFAGATPEGDAAAASRPVFFIVDIERESNIAHWLMEYAVFLREWPDILSIYPQARLVIGSEAPFKRRTLPLFGVADSRVVLLADMPRRNYCIFVPYQSITDPAVDSNLFLERWLAFVSFVRCASGLDPRAYNRVGGTTPLDAELGPAAPTPVLVVPRGNKGNYKRTDRSYPGFEPLVEWASSLGGRALFVNVTKDFRAQVRAIASARIIVTTEGSAFYVSCAWALGSTIFVVGTSLLEQRRVIRPIAVMFETIVARNNTVVDVESAAEVVPIIMGRFAHLLL